MYAVSAAGQSPKATRTVTLQIPRPPTAPLNVSAAPGDRKATVTWGAPADPGTSPIDAYEISVYDSAGEEVDGLWDGLWVEAGPSRRTRCRAW